VPMQNEWGSEGVAAHDGFVEVDDPIPGTNADDVSCDQTSGPTSTAPRVVFIHIPKTAGTTLQQVLRSNAMHFARLANVFKGGGGRVKEPDYERMVANVQARPRARFFWGHTPFAIASYMPAEWETQFITFLRDPVDRAISQYYGMIQRLDGVDIDAEIGPSRKRNVSRGALRHDVPYEVALTDAAFVSDNLQTRMLCGLPRPFDEVTDEMLDRAIENLGRIRCVGLVERFDESLVLLKRRIGYQRIAYDQQRVNTSRPRGASVPEELRRAAEKANRFDQELYRHAVAQLDSAPELGELEFRAELAALRAERQARIRRSPTELELLERDLRPVKKPREDRIEKWIFGKAAARGASASDDAVATAVRSKQERARNPKVVRGPKLRRADRARNVPDD
jgi:hypothetical protein